MHAGRKFFIKIFAILVCIYLQDLRAVLLGLADRAITHRTSTIVDKPTTILLQFLPSLPKDLGTTKSTAIPEINAFLETKKRNTLLFLGLGLFLFC